MAPARLRAAVLLTVAAVARAAFTCDPSNSAALCTALGALYAQTNGAGWKNSSGWSSAAAGSVTNFCSFAGLTCAGSSPVKLCAPASAMCSPALTPRGAVCCSTIPWSALCLPPPWAPSPRSRGCACPPRSSAAQLRSEFSCVSHSHLCARSFQQNQLSGTIPAEIGNLSALTKLNLGGNSLSGTIPATFVSLTQLNTLNISSNAFSGALPAWPAAPPLTPILCVRGAGDLLPWCCAHSSPQLRVEHGALWAHPPLLHRLLLLQQRIRLQRVRDVVLLRNLPEPAAFPAPALSLSKPAAAAAAAKPLSATAQPDTASTAIT